MGVNYPDRPLTGLGAANAKEERPRKRRDIIERRMVMRILVVGAIVGVSRSNSRGLIFGQQRF